MSKQVPHMPIHARVYLWVFGYCQKIKVEIKSHEMCFSFTAHCVL